MIREMRYEPAQENSLHRVLAEKNSKPMPFLGKDPVQTIEIVKKY